MTIDQFKLIAELAPLRRDLVSDGYDQALAHLAARFPLKVHHYASGTPCWTWRVPPRWTCAEAYVETCAGRRLIDQALHPLCVASYSVALDKVVPRAELLEHLHVHPYLDQALPFIFHYYRPNWSFGCGQATRQALTEANYHVVIRSRHEPGVMKVGEWVLPGDSDQVVVLAGHLCHPGQANDGLSGVVTGLAIMAHLAQQPRRHYEYRLLITPETIGSVAWLSHHEALIPRIHGGLFLDMTGVDLPPALQLSFHGDTEADRCFRFVHERAEPNAWTAPYRGVVGNDERQFNAPGVRVPMLSYARAHPWGHPQRPYPQYHSNCDNIDIVNPARLEQSRQTVVRMLEVLDANTTPSNRFKGEICLAQYGLDVDRQRELELHRNMLKIMDRIDGGHSVVDIAGQLGIEFETVRGFIAQLEGTGLVEQGRV